MTRNLKMLGLALAAMLVLGAASAQGAFAAEEFHSDNKNTTLTAEADPATEAHPETNIQKFNAAGHTIECSEANFMATQTGKTTTPEVTFQPSANGGAGAAGFGGCEFLGIPVTVTMHSCDFVFHSNGKIDISGTNCKTKHQVETAGEGTAEPIEFKATILGGLASCKVEIGEQSGLNGATYTNTDTNGETSGKEITAEVKIEERENENKEIEPGIKYTSTSTGGGCTAHTTGEDGKYEGNQTVTGETTTEPHEMVGIWWQ